jgi:putative Mg2+ transporter-C (MgtC) family protein
MSTNLLLPGAFTGNFLIRLAVACLLGGLIGLERDLHGRAAGVRTNMLVSMGSALFMLVSEAVAVVYSEGGGGGGGGSVAAGLRVDPSRIAAQIVTGIGFLGAGAIIKVGFDIRGLTTAACLWVSAGIGMAAGAGFFQIAGAVTLFSLFALVVLSHFEKLYAKDSYRTLQLTTGNDADVSGLIRAIGRKGLKILYLSFDRNYETGQMVVSFTIRVFIKGVTDRLSHEIVSDLEGSGIPIQKIKWGH